MHVGHSHEIGCYCGLVSLFEAGIGKGAGNEESGGRIGGRRRLMGVKGTSVVSWGSILISKQLY